MASMACTQTKHVTDQPSDEERAEITADIKQRNQDLIDAWAQEDAFDEWMELHVDEDYPSWAEEPNLITLSGATYASKSAMDTAFRDMLSDRITHMTMIDESVAVLSKTHAVHFGEFTWSVTRDGASGEKYLATATTVWTMEGDDEWKILHYHQSWPSTTPVPAE